MFALWNEGLKRYGLVCLDGKVRWMADATLTRFGSRETASRWKDDLLRKHPSLDLHVIDITAAVVGYDCPIVEYREECGAVAGRMLLLASFDAKTYLAYDLPVRRLRVVCFNRPQKEGVIKDG